MKRILKGQLNEKKPWDGTGALTYLFGKLSNAVICHKISSIVRMTSFLKCLSGVCACNFYENGSATGMVFEVFGRIIDCQVEISDMST